MTFELIIQDQKYIFYLYSKSYFWKNQFPNILEIKLIFK